MQTRKFWTHATMVDESVVSVEVPVNPNPEAFLGTHPAPTGAWFTPRDVGVVIDAMVGHHPLALTAFDVMPDAVADAVIRFAFRHELIRQEGQRVTLTRHGRRYLRTYDRGA